MARSLVEVKCFNCGKKVKKLKGEYNRSLKLGRRFFCSRSCSVTIKNKEFPNINLKQLIPDNRRDEYTSFRFFMKVVKQREINTKYRLGKCNNIDLKYLKELWENQEGICPITGWNLVLPHSTEGWKTKRNSKRASLDRIDSSKGYMRGNVRFISFMANIARSNMEDEELIKFCDAVTRKNKNDKRSKNIQ